MHAVHLWDRAYKRFLSMLCELKCHLDRFKFIDKFEANLFNVFVGVNERVRIFMQTFQEEPHHKRTSISLNYALLGSLVSSLDHVELLTLTKTLVCVVKETVMLNHIMYCGPSSAGNTTVKLTDHYYILW